MIHHYSPRNYQFLYLFLQKVPPKSYLIQICKYRKNQISNNDIRIFIFFPFINHYLVPLLYNCSYYHNNGYTKHKKYQDTTPLIFRWLPLFMDFSKKFLWFKLYNSNSRVCNNYLFFCNFMYHHIV